MELICETAWKRVDYRSTVKIVNDKIRSEFYVPICSAPRETDARICSVQKWL